MLPSNPKMDRKWVRINPKRSLLEFKKLKAELAWFGFTPELSDLANRLRAIGTARLRAE